MKWPYLILATVITLHGCKPNQERGLSAAHSITTDTTIASSCPFLSKDNHGNVVMSWVKELNDTDAIMCYSVLGQDGSIAHTYEIPASKGLHPHGENMPKVACKTDGTLIAMWGIANPNPNNKYSGLVSYAVSKNGGKDWSAAIPLVADTSSYDQRYFDMGVLPSGEIALVWFDSRGKNGKEGSTLYYATSGGTDRFVGEKPIAESCCPCCRTDLMVDKKGNIHVAFRDIIGDSIRDMVHMVSENAGKSFTEPVRISADNWAINGCPHTGPTMAENSKGLHFAWYTMGTGNGVFYDHSADQGKTFSSKENVSPEPSAKHPQLLAAHNDDLFIAWDQSIKKGEDYNNIILMQHRSPAGAVVSNHSITTTSTVATYPVLIENSNKNIFIAYTVQNGDKSKVYYNKYSL